MKCEHCGRDIEDRGHPVARDNHFAWYSVWVHVPGGYTACYPQLGGNSSRAEPTAHDPDCECGGWPQG